MNNKIHSKTDINNINIDSIIDQIVASIQDLTLELTDLQ